MATKAFDPRDYVQPGDDVAPTLFELLKAGECEQPGVLVSERAAHEAHTLLECYNRSTDGEAPAALALAIWRVSRNLFLQRWPDDDCPELSPLTTGGAADASETERDKARFVMHHASVALDDLAPVDEHVDRVLNIVAAIAENNVDAGANLGA